MTLVISGDISLRRTWQPMDPDAATYITAVETADGQALEEPVKIAIDNFVLGCKADGIWNAIKASCILAGARTLDGALVPLAGTAPTNYNFVSADYNRKTGLVGDGSTKYLNTNRSVLLTNSGNNHASVNIQQGAAGTWLGLLSSVNTYFSLAASGIFNLNSFVLRLTGIGLIGFCGTARFSSTEAVTRINKQNNITLSASSSPTFNNSYMIFAAQTSSIVDYSAARINFYSIGESLDLAKLDARVTDMINKFAEVIP